MAGFCIDPVKFCMQLHDNSPNAHTISNRYCSGSLEPEYSCHDRD